MTRSTALAEALLDMRAAGLPVTLDAWRARGLAPADLAAGYVAQDVGTELREKAGFQRRGYKIGATNQAARDLLSVSEPFYGRLYEQTIYRGSISLNTATEALQVIEPEIALQIGRDLDPAAAPYDAEAIRAATSALLPAIEVIACALDPWTQAGGPTLIADNGAHGHWIMGEPMTDWAAFDPMESAVEVRIASADETPDQLLTGYGKAVEGGPFGATAWLANKLIEHGQTLKAGDFVTTGTVTPPQPVVAGQTITASFGALGTVSVSF